jgi:hypothetical protein
VPISTTILSDHNFMKRRIVHSIEIKYARTLIINIYPDIISKLWIRLILPIKRKRTDMNTNIYVMLDCIIIEDKSTRKKKYMHISRVNFSF